MSKPDPRFVTIKNNQELILQMISELVLEPRLNAIKWSKITKQTPNIKIGYPGQHLASLITGMDGERTGARGNDLIDGSEVKSCSRIDQLDLCKTCGHSVARLEETCSSCGSEKIERKNDSKWLISVRNEDDLEVLLNQVGRVLLMLGDYPNFDEGDFETLRIQAFEIWPREERHHRFSEIMTNYYRKIYLAHRKNSPTKTPAPKNFWPYSYQFYICNPVKVFSCIITKANTAPQIIIEHYSEPAQDRSKIASEPMPSAILTDVEIQNLVQKLNQDEAQEITSLKIDLKELKAKQGAELKSLIPLIPEKYKAYLELRDTDKISVAKNKYSRRKN